MVVLNKFLEEMNKIAVRNVAGVTPTHVYFAGSDNTYNGNETTISNDYLHKAIIWSQTGIDSKFTLDVTTTEAVGSYIETYGFITDATVGSGYPLVNVPSDIGSKTDGFSIEIEGEVILRRPI